MVGEGVEEEGIIVDVEIEVDCFVGEDMFEVVDVVLVEVVGGEDFVGEVG